MRNANPSTGGGGGGADAPTPLQFDVALALNNQPSYPCKKMSFASYSSPYHHLHHRQASEIGRELFLNPTDATHQSPSGFSYKPTTDRDMAASGKVLFTATQWQELERQTMIYKYILASTPVPPQLLLPLSTQSNRANMGLKFSNGSDPEPWRCRRTDGKKWRCSRDVAPDQKYCEHHAHKTRPRSRKPVEIQSHNTKRNYENINTNNNKKNDNNNPSSDWFMKSGSIVEPKKEQFFKQEIKGNNQHNNCYLETSASARRQNFIDSWSRTGNGDDCSLTLSMQSNGNQIDQFNDHEAFQMAVGMLEGDRVMCEDMFKPLTHGSWEGSTPGGPLGEALCLGINSNANTPPDVASPHGYRNTNV